MAMSRAGGSGFRLLFYALLVLFATFHISNVFAMDNDNTGQGHANDDEILITGQGDNGS